MECGGIISKGNCKALATKTGMYSTLGEAIAEMAKLEKNREISTYQKILKFFLGVLFSISFVAVLIIGIKLISADVAFMEVLSLAVVLLVASIPIAMQVVCTATLAMGSRSMSEKKASVTRLAAIEEMAGMVVLCSDKTGTLT